MEVQTITYDDKQFLNQNSDIADVNKCNDTDLNEIKSVVNNNAIMLRGNTTYSLTETDTGKTWIDGKPIYRKIVILTSIGASSSTYNHNILDLDEITDIRGVFFNTYGWELITRVHGTNSTWNTGVGDVTTTTFKFFYGSQYTTSSFSKVRVIFEYTKTTD